MFVLLALPVVRLLNPWLMLPNQAVVDLLCGRIHAHHNVLALLDDSLSLQLVLQPLVVVVQDFLCCDVVKCLHYVFDLFESLLRDLVGYARFT